VRIDASPGRHQDEINAAVLAKVKAIL